ncbi:MAG: fibronectin type III domain-containing protein [Bacteroidales bacterium]|nr:fibronectin type III domain-containing protein [Bacteroidales bacterium]
MAFINNLLGRNIKTLGLLFTIILLSSRVSHAQTFPVQANIHIAPPYSVYLSQYTSPEQEKVMVNILLRDPVITSLDVKFRFTIEGGGIKLTTNPAWNQQPYNLVGGLVTILPQELIAEHLKPQNLLIEGVNPQEFFRSGKLPEGFYEFKVEVIEYRRGITISNVGRAGIWLTLNEAPRIVFPLGGQKVKATNPQMLNFTWIPGGASSPLSILNTMYEFTLVELPDKSIDPTVAITTASNASKFVKTLDQTSLFYGSGEMPLTPGKTYAYRVKAYNTQGYELFKNGGYSEVRTFTFGDACNAPVSFSLQNPKQSSFDINVYTDPSNTAWKSRFREKTAGADLQSVPNDQSNWSELKAEDGTSLKSIMGLKPTTTYEVQVKGLCGDIASDYTQTQTITTKPMVDANRSCSNNPTPFAVDNVASLTQLKKNDIFFAALFPIKVIDVKSQGGGKFSGRGIATLPLFNTGLAVTFDNVGINQLMQLTSGEVKVVRDELNITLFGDTPTPPGGGGAGGTGGSGGTTIVYPPINDTIVIPAVYDSLVVNSNTLIIYPPNGGAPVTVDLGGNACTLLVPADGNMDNAKIVYDGAAYPYHPGQGNINNDDPKSFTGLIAHFKPDNSSLLGFDTLKYSVLANYYKQLTVAGKQRYIPWKAIKDGTPELVNLRIKQGTDRMPFSNLKVKQIGMGNLTPSTGAGTQSQTYTLSGSYKGLEESVIAYYTADGKENYAGGLYIATYEQKKYKLFLVPLPGVNIPDDAKGRLTNELSTIYSQAVVTWNVDILKDFNGVDLGDNGLDWANKDMLSSYNAEMNSVISAFKGWKPDADPDAYYLFIVPKFSEGNVEGFMPRNRRFGFVTQLQLDGRTIAHELGHGAFNLKHTFSPSDWNIQQGITDNLMDYPSTAGQTGKKLWKPQWDFICNPEITTGLWDGMEEGAIISDTYYWTPAGTPIKMTKTCTTVIDIQKLKSGEYLNGILYSWIDGNDKYVADIKANVFKGYINSSTNKAYIDNTKLNQGDEINVNSIIYLGNCTKEDVITKYQVSEAINRASGVGKSLIPSFPYTNGIKANKLSFICSDSDLKQYGLNFYNSYLEKVVNIDAQNELHKIAKLADELGKLCFEGFVSGKKWDNSQASSNNYFTWYFNVSNVQDYSFASLISVTKQLEKYKDALNTFKIKSDNNTISKDEILKIVNENFVFGADFKYLFKAPFQELSSKQRINIIKKLVEGWVTGRSNVGSRWQEEDIILELFNTSKPEQHKEMLDGIYKEKLLFGLVHGVDGDNYYKLIETIVGWVIKEYPCPQDFSVKSIIEDKQYLLFNDNFFGKSNSEDIQRTGDVSMGVISWSGKVEYGVYSNPYHYILVKFKNSFKIGESIFAADITYKLPALYVYMLFCKDTRDKWVTIGRTGFDVGLFALGTGEIKTAVELGSWGKAAIGVVDMGIGFVDIGVNDVFEKEVKSKYPDFYEKWQKISLVWGIGRLTQVGIEALVKDTYNECKALRVTENLSEESKNAILTAEKKLESEFGGILDKAGDVVKQSQNLKIVDWKNNVKGFLSNIDAQQFWNNTTKNFSHLIDGDFYLKFDEATGNLLFANYKTGEILGFYEGVINTTIIAEKGGLQNIISKLKIYHGVSGAPSYIISNVSSGARIISNSNKTTTIVGNYTRYGYSAGDMKTLVGNELLGNLKTAQFGSKKGGFNVLNVSDEMIAANGGYAKFWETFNEPWLTEAINRGDDIWAASNPLDLSLVYKGETAIVNSFDEIKTFLSKSTIEIEKITGFGKEIKTLIDNGYTYNSNIKMFVK